MSDRDPASALHGVETGNICDSCNKRIDHGEFASMYATYYEGCGWTPRRTWCTSCCPETIDPGTEGADEVIIEAVLWRHRLAGVRVKDRSRPREDCDERD